ncbi:polysaccharide lyase, partial [Acanthamoeba castellanii str. Neff]
CQCFFGHLKDGVDRQGALSYANTIHPNGSWSHIDYRRGCGVKRALWPATEHLDRVLVMTKAWAAPESTAHLDPVLLAKIVMGLDWWLVRDYSDEGCTDTNDPSDCCGMTGMWHPNWWWNMVGVPLRIGPTCLLLRSARPSVLTPTRRAGCSAILRRSDWRGATGANTLWLAQGAVWDSLLRNDQTKVAAAYGASEREARYSPGSEDGIKRDGSFLQHSGVLYTGGYGSAFASVYVALFSAAAGTSFAPSAVGQEVFSKLVLDGLRWAVVHSPQRQVSFFDPSVTGRGIARRSSGAGLGLDFTALANLTVGWARQAEFADFARMFESREGSGLTGNRIYPAADYMVHRRADYVVSIKAFSERVATSECINAENRRGLHLSDGAMFVHRSGKEYCGGPDQAEDAAVFPLWDWHHVPGTTVDWGVDRLECSQVYSKGLTGFVGGASDGTYGAFAMRFVSAFTTNLSLKKAWFMFDDEIVVLVADITSADPRAPVHSVLDSKVLHGNVYTSVLGNQAPLDIGVQSTTWPWWLHHDGVGYVFPGNVNTLESVALHLDLTKPRTGNWSAIGSDAGTSTLPTFTAWLTHQQPPVAGDSLAYVLVPSVSLDAFDPRRTLEAGEVVSNSATSLVVVHRGLGLAGVVLWAARHRVRFALEAAEWELQADHPCVLLAREAQGGNELQLTVAEPTQRLTRVALRVTRRRSRSGREAPETTSAILAIYFNARDGSSQSATWRDDLPYVAISHGTTHQGLVTIFIRTYWSLFEPSKP